MGQNRKLEVGSRVHFLGWKIFLSVDGYDPGEREN